ncbi:conjugal transfer protein TrbC, partial [Escherichia coli]
MSLPAMAALYVEAKKNGWHSEGYAALESYLENTPGFLLANAEYPETWEARAFEQHNYMSRQFLKTLSLFNETYGHVFPEDSGDIRMDDIFHNDRIHIVMIPSL